MLPPARPRMPLVSFPGASGTAPPSEPDSRWEITEQQCIARAFGCPAPTATTEEMPPLVLQIRSDHRDHLAAPMFQETPAPVATLILSPDYLLTQVDEAELTLGVSPSLPRGHKPAVTGLFEPAESAMACRGACLLLNCVPPLVSTRSTTRTAV